MICIMAYSVVELVVGRRLLVSTLHPSNVLCRPRGTRVDTRLKTSKDRVATVMVKWGQEKTLAAGSQWAKGPAPPLDVSSLAG